MRRIALLSVSVVIATVATMLNSFVNASEPVHELEIVAKKFTFEPALIQVMAGEPVRLLIHSADTTHGFSIRALKIDVQVPHGGDAVSVEFTAPPAGRYEVACSEFCGAGHGQMKAALVSVAATRAGR